MKPTTDDMRRDAAADLVVCEAASPGLWVEAHPKERSASQPHGGDYSILAGPKWLSLDHGFAIGTADAVFMAEAREALPAWIRRAAAAEALLRRLAGAYDGEPGESVYAIAEEARELLGGETP